MERKKSKCYGCFDVLWRRKFIVDIHTGEQSQRQGHLEQSTMDMTELSWAMWADVRDYATLGCHMSRTDLNTNTPGQGRGMGIEEI